MVCTPDDCRTEKVGKISLAEFEAGGKDGLPSFTGYSHLGRK